MIVDPTRESIYDPLEFDLVAATKEWTTWAVDNDSSLLRSIDTSLLHTFVKQPQQIEKSKVLDTLARLLLYHPWTIKLIHLYRPIAIDLLARLANPGFLDFMQADPLATSSLVVSKTETLAKTFALTLPIVPQIQNLVVSYFMHSPSLFERINQHSSHASAKTSKYASSLHDLLYTTYQLLHYSTSTFAFIWNISSLVPLLQHQDVTVRFLVASCLAMAFGLNDRQSKQLVHASLGMDLDRSSDPLMATFDGQQVDLRMLRLYEEQRLAHEQITFTQNNYPSCTSNDDKLSLTDLSPLTIDLCGILMAQPFQQHPTSSHDKQPELVLTGTTSRNLHAIALALSIGAPTLLEGVTGAGKTSLVEDLAIRTGRADQLVKIHLGDQTDPKVLLGTYVSTSTPGSFRWQAGVLTTAVQEGRWVLIEDIDLAPAEVISVLLPLLEKGRLFIPSRGEEIKAKEGFHLFGTRSLIPSRSGRLTSRGGDLVAGANLWTHVQVEPLTMEELELVVRQKFNHIGNFAPIVMQVFQTIVDLYQDTNFSSSSASNGRHISSRDLIKWCHRIDALFGAHLGSSMTSSDILDESIRQDLFSEAIDCFCGMISDYAIWVSVLERIGEPLQLSSAVVRHYVDQYKPTFESSISSVRVGRVNLTSMVTSGRQRQQHALIKPTQQRSFAMTNHALRLLEKIAVSVHLNEPVLLVGETGCGKTTVVQQLADMMHQRLIVVNLSQQSDSSDLLGGFKPVDGKVLAMPLRDAFDTLFERTFSVKKNAKFLEAFRKAYIHQKWVPFVTLLKQAIKMANQKFALEDNAGSKQQAAGEPASTKRVTSPQLREAWKKIKQQIDEFEVQQVQAKNKFVFSFIEGALVKAVRQGDWILMDEINLATTETLECLSGLLEDAEGSLLLTEKGDVEPIQRHPNFRMFACMNPSTDVGKRDLPPGLRNRMTEFYVHSPDTRYDDLLQIVRQYLAPVSAGDDHACNDVAQFYSQAKQLAQQHKLVDGANQRPHFSIRTLARALTYVVQIQPVYGLRRSLYEGFCMTFLTQLDKDSEALMRQLIHKTLLNNVKQVTQLVTQIPRQPSPNFIQFGYFWLEQGPFEPIDDTHYIITPSVETKLYNLARVIMSRKFPVLIQGPTSAGKTSMIEYLAKKTGHRFVRINNHEHTDLQEYLGTYVSNPDGQLVFQEGVLVEALRHGYWIVLDELNLAPSDVLEALNRLLDDNRELLIPETQEVVKPHPHFMLFATQNPAGLYGGRKALSRAFRNRFLELHFDDIPQEELETILSQRCQIAPSYCKRLVKVYQTLMERRQSTRIFEQRHGFITLRDLFRWAGRDANGYEELAEHGYMLLAERCRRPEEKMVVKQVLEMVMKCELDEAKLYDPSRLEEFAIYDRLLRDHAAKSGQDTQLVWTKAMRRLFTLVARCLAFNEPVLLVGETGCGKTTVCQMLAETYSQELMIVNCHQNTETSDLLGGQRPVRQDNVGQNDEGAMEKKELFAWHDGPLVQSMRDGHLFLLDEISLADDSVLERLNSVLEPSRLLVLAEKGGKQVEELIGAPRFQFLATMNPGGDYGKKELSPALRNRFTEIWVPSVTDRDDLHSILVEQLANKELLLPFADKMLDFVSWYTHALGQSNAVISLRDMLAWVRFLNVGVAQQLDPHLCFVHGCFLVLLDALGTHGASGTYLAGDVLKEFRQKCLHQLMAGADDADLQSLMSSYAVTLTDDQLRIGPFAIPRGQNAKADVKFTLQAPTTGQNAMRVVRAMQLKKPILLEGSPGVGKTSLISAMAAAAGQPLVRINLSEQTDLMDLFGSDLPVEGGQSGEFAWRDAPFLQAMKAGHWVLLDELNLASQSVLEGLNSCLDHRGAVYIPELDREFFCAEGFRVFGAQNPLQQGGGRKGLPKSFVNRFTQVYVEQLTADDLLFICTHLFPAIPPATLNHMITFNSQMYDQTMVHCSFGRKGSPWEFNLRDVFRWLELMESNHVTDPSVYLDIIYLQRMRANEDRQKVIALYESVFGCTYDHLPHPSYALTPDTLVIGHASISRTSAGLDSTIASSVTDDEEHLLQTFLSPMASLIDCVQAGWMAILTGPSASGKTSLVRMLSKMTGNRLEEFAMNNSVDTMELLGGFEQVDLNRHRQVIVDTLRRLTHRATKCLLTALSSGHGDVPALLQQIQLLNERWYALEQQQRLQQQNRNGQSLDFTLIAAVLESISGTATIDRDAENAISNVQGLVQRLQSLESQSIAGKFEWIDGLLIDALEHGHWLLIDNANLCNPSVLDRLNPLFENNGVLMVNERGLVDGQVKVIQPHPNFRMFMTVDPQHGELSRAMRNRGIEIALVDAKWNDNEQDVLKLANGLGVRGSQLPLVIRDLQDDAMAFSRPGRTPTKNVRDYLLMARYLVERLQRGQSLKDAVQDAFYHVFVDVKGAPATLTSLLQDTLSPNLLAEFNSSSNCPLFVGGSLFRQDAQLAMVALQGACLLNLLLSPDSQQDQLEIAGDFFLEAVTVADTGLRQRWLAFVHQHFSVQHNHILERLAALLRSLHDHALTASVAPRPNTESMVCLFKKKRAFRLLIRLCKQDYAMKQMSTTAQRLKVANLTSIQQSFSFHQQRLGESQLSHPVIAHFYPLLVTITQALLQWLDGDLLSAATASIMKRLNDILDLYDFVWAALQSIDFPLDQLLLVLRSLKGLMLPDQVLEAEASRFTDCQLHLDQIISSFDFETSRFMKQLWKHYSPVTLATPSLHALELELNQINLSLDAFHPQRGKRKIMNRLLIPGRSLTFSVFRIGNHRQRCYCSC
ncbi:P-loop containing nucleoside triphosphate hydrolase protein [Hesseltinella vesiculosa]|uniref:Midasin n=1 Tax=Hesseltinella vesiculosa TaxID=101127 RepID=A0A1X2GWS4_9FUNG|nr:P-loop containing nucleoside triphosphate hydrolase protein [Hesseltinella vesiculosa]